MTLPNFVIAGAFKAGTTSLFHYIGQHPEVYMSPIKEPRFFAYDPADPEYVESSEKKFPIRTLDAYEELFASATDELAIGEASPVYLGSEIAPEKMHKLLPDVKLIFCLRHPVNRLYSLYLMNCRDGRDTRSVYDACAPGGELATYNLYCPSISRWLERFRCEQIGIFVLEKLSLEPVKEIQAQYAFLGVDENFEPNLTRNYNTGGIPKGRLAGNFYRGLIAVRNHRYTRALRPYLPEIFRLSYASIKGAAIRKPDPLPDDLAKELRLFYRKDVLELERLLDIDLSIWNLY